MKEVIDKLGYSTHSGNNNIIVKNRLQKYQIDYSHFSPYQHVIKRNEKNVFMKNSTASQSTLRKWHLKGRYTPYKCSICNMEPFWQGKKLTLILDHINGSNHDNRLENLRWVCPNCNQQLETTGFKGGAKDHKLHKKYYCIECGKEVTYKRRYCHKCASKLTRKAERPSREKLKELIRNFSFTKIGDSFGVSGNAIRKWCINENLPKRKREILQYTDSEWENI